MRTPRLALLLAVVAPLLAACSDDPDQPRFVVDESFRRETWIQREPLPVDMLWVVDTSCSMTDEQDALVSNFPSFISFFLESGLSFQLGVTSTDVDEADTEGALDGHLNGDPPVLSDETEDLEQAFLDRALMGITQNHGDEKGLHASYTALETFGETANAGLLRDDANLAVIIVSDEPDYSEEGQPDSGNYIGHAEYSAWLEGKKGDGGPAAQTSAERAALSGIVGIGPLGVDDPNGCNQPDDPEQQWGAGARRGTGYLEAIQETGGLAQSICDEDWVELLGRLGLLVAGMIDHFVLSEAPEPESIDVYVGSLPVGGWEFHEDDRSVQFLTVESIPRPGQEVRIEYDARPQ